MNNLLQKVAGKFSLMVIFILMSVSSIAQDKKVEIDINTKGNDSNIFMQPWMWVVGGAVFILILVALLKSGKSK